MDGLFRVSGRIDLANEVWLSQCLHSTGLMFDLPNGYTTNYSPPRVVRTAKWTSFKGSEIGKPHVSTLFGVPGSRSWATTGDRTWSFLMKHM